MIRLPKQADDYKIALPSAELEKNIAFFKEIFKNDAVLRMKRVTVSGTYSYSCALFYMDGMANVRLLNESIVKPMLSVSNPKTEEKLTDYIKNQVLFACETTSTRTVSDMLRAVLYGDTLLLTDGTKEAITVNTKGWRTRGISEPEDERILQGPREGFDEAAMLNLAMIRRKLLTPDLCTELLRIGRRSDTVVFICYLGSLVDASLLSRLKDRLAGIDIDGILDTNYIAELIRDKPHSLFKTTGTTERPDVVAARLLEGRIALVVDGTPVVLTLPYLFSENFQSDEDYYLNYTVASVGRILRYICFFIATSIPALFIAATTFHKELLPTSLAITVTRLRGGVPFSAFAECLLLILVFEILREAGVRTAQSLGHALSIVGGLVVGQAAVEAGIVSTPMLIIVALSGISGLMIPRLKGAVFYSRLGLVCLSALFGLYGYSVGITLMLIHIFELSSFGTDSTLSLSVPSGNSLKDTLWRSSWQNMKTRPLFCGNRTRKGGGE